MVGRASDVLKLCCGQMSSEITAGENDEREKKRHMKCISRGQAYHQNQMTVTFREEGKGADTVATKISKWGSLIQHPHAGKPAGVFPGPQLAQGAAEAARVYARLDKTVHEVSCLGRVLQPEEMSLQGENACLPL